MAAATAVEAPKGKTIREHSETFLETYKPESKPSTKRNRTQSINHLLPFFGDKTIDQLRAANVGAYVAAELAYEAGLRAGEIRGLQWTDIKDGQLTIRRALEKETGRV